MPHAGLITLAPAPAIEVAGLHKRYGDTVAVDDLSLSVASGEVFGLVGPNGAGKTTTLECLLGLRLADAGTVSVLGLDTATGPDRSTCRSGRSSTRRWRPAPAGPNGTSRRIGRADRWPKDEGRDRRQP